MGLLDGVIQTIVGQAADFLMLDCTFIAVTEGTYTPGGGAITPTEVNHPCRGWVDEDVQMYMDRGTISKGNRVVGVLQTSLPGVVPKRSTATSGESRPDKIVARGVESIIEDVGEDPASATWIFGVSP